EIRSMISQRRSALTPEQPRRYGQMASARMLSFTPVVLAQTVDVFLSFYGELDSQTMIEQLWREGKLVYLTVIHPFSPGYLLF
ncbi:5-formyltetrahydrofolate cyclo-ligase, partial [Salmonella enterica subsp. enterica serovar Infantis]